MTAAIRTVCGHDCPDMCSLLAHVENGRLVRIDGDPEQPFTAGFVCAKVRQEPELVHSADRVRTPLRRHGAKGEGRFTAISWDDALDEILGRWRAILQEDGPLAILGYCYSAHQGQINRWLPMALFHALGTTRLLPGTVCDSCADAAWEATLGPVGGADPEDVRHADLVVAWGSDLVTTNVHFWAKVEEVRRRGTPLVVIDPRRSRTAARADWHIAPRVGTDVALALGVMHLLVRGGLADRSFIARETVGFERLEADVLPRFGPERVEAITGIRSEDIERFARRYGEARASFIRIGSGMSRTRSGGQAIRAVALLPGVTGAYARRGGGALLSTVPGFGLRYDALRRPSGATDTRTVNHSRLGEALLTLDAPPIRSLFVASNNPAVTCPDAGAVRRGLTRDDLFTVVHDVFLTGTARYADIVLPAATYLETEDFFRSYGSYYVQRSVRAIDPVGEAWSNERLARELARRLGVDDPVFGMTTDELVALLFRGASGPAAAVDPETLRAGQPIKLTPYPDGQRFGTPSGKLEFYAARLASEGLEPMPDWETRPEDGASGPLRLLTAPSYFLPHTAFAGNAILARREGAPVCVLHPDDAGARGLGSGDTAELYNERGTVRLDVRVSEEAPRGVVVVPGPREIDAGASVNVLCDAAYSDLGAGATYQDTRLDVRRAPEGARA